MTTANAELFTPAFQTNPHPVYARLRTDEPVQLVTMPGGNQAWLVTRYEDARQALADPRFSKRGVLTPTGPNGLVDPAVLEAMNTHMLTADPPDHTRLRRLVSAAFTNRRVDLLRPRIEEITTGLLDAMAGRDEVDLIDAFAFPLPIQVICELLGVPAEDRESFREWSDTIVTGVLAGDRLPWAFASMLDYLREMLARKRVEPADDLVSALIEVREEGDRLAENELTSTVFLLLIAGHETTVNLLGNAVYLLLSQRERWEELRADPELLPSAIEEFLRYESPVETATFRIAVADVELGGVTIPAGDPVLIGLLSGNRDDRRFAAAERFDLARRDNAHLAFGHGIHYCLGAPLARLEARIALGALLARYGDLRLAVDPADVLWRPGVLMRGLTGLPVTGLG
ncbi:cytochrome P450 [Longispora sp. K20-0274]|uniref:cytochrome P450 family protein n=1 Tax=Longispora sp. K20-0274 TaxID=3088255 RepID=UPI003999E47B